VYARLVRACTQIDHPLSLSYYDAESGYPARWNMQVQGRNGSRFLYKKTAKNGLYGVLAEVSYILDNYSAQPKFLKCIVTAQVPLICLIASLMLSSRKSTVS